MSASSGTPSQATRCATRRAAPVGPTCAESRITVCSPGVATPTPKIVTMVHATAKPE